MFFTLNTVEHKNQEAKLVFYGKKRQHNDRCDYYHYLKLGHSDKNAKEQVIIVPESSGAETPYRIVPKP